MFGYIKPFVPDLRVREHELYRAIYCGLCRSMGKHTGCASRLTLSYDFTFLAAVRLALESECEPEVKVTRCAASPLKRRAIMDDNPVLAYCAACAAILTREKVKDDIADSKGGERFCAKLLLPGACGMVSKAQKQNISVPEKEICESLARLSSLEKEGCSSVDLCADCFGELLSKVFSHGLEGSKRAVAAAIGNSIGRLIYVLDCADDREKDKKSGSFNPLNIEPISPEALSLAVRLELTRCEAAVNLIEKDAMPELRELIYNVIYEGLPKEADRIFNKESCQKKGNNQ